MAQRPTAFRAAVRRVLHPTASGEYVDGVIALRETIERIRRWTARGRDAIAFGQIHGIAGRGGIADVIG